MIFHRLTISALALVTITATVTASSQTPTTPPKKPATTATTHTPTTHPAAAAACIKLPEISPKIPALPPGLPCPKPLYTLSTVPTVKLTYVSPLESPNLSESLG